MQKSIIGFMSNEKMFVESLHRKVTDAEMAACWSAHFGTEEQLRDAEQALESVLAEFEEAHRVLAA